MNEVILGLTSIKICKIALLMSFYKFSLYKMAGLVNSKMAGLVNSERCTLNSSKNACSDTPKLSTTTTFDSLLRSKLIHTSDGSTDIYVNKTYYTNNKVKFASYPSISSTVTSGTNYSYDDLGRLETTSVSGGGTISHQYLAGNKRKVTDAENNQTTTTYLAYGSPDYSKATKIESPEEVTTDIVFDIFGNVSSIRQHSTKDFTVDQTEYRAYDNQKQLCQIERSDVGTTVYNRNTLGEIQWIAQGQTASSNTSCNNSASASSKVAYKYDNLRN